MPTNPFNEYPINLGRVLALAYGIDARPYDTELQLWVKVAESLGASVTPYDDLDAVLSRIADAGGATPCPPCPPCPEQSISAEPDTDTFLSQLYFEPSNNNVPLTVVTSVTVGTAYYLGNMIWEQCPDLITLSWPNLTTFGDGALECSWTIIDLPNFTTLSVPALQTFQGGIVGFAQLTIDSCPALTSLSFPALTTLSSSDLRVTDNPALTTISLPVWVPTVDCSADFSLNALSQASVDHILARHVASPTWGNNGEALDLSGGTNSPPGAQGLLDVATLLGRGAAVDTN